ncbi:MAG: prolyl oligopeptidase family serine peptidase, partial [Pseudomonadota bacterium]
MSRVGQFCFFAAFFCLLQGCSSGGSGSPQPDNSADDSSPTGEGQVFRNPEFGIEIEYDVVYAQGQSHSDWNAPDSVPVDLLLDIYTPVSNAVERPAMVFIHGGGFIGGDKGTDAPVEFARYFAERGFVSLSINYRLLGDYGTVPTSFIETIDAVPLVSDDDRDQAKAMYPAVRDAKAALRWLVANANEYGVNPDQISVIGGSAGSFISIALGASEIEDFSGELSIDVDPTLASTHRGNDPIVASVVNHWGGPFTVDLLELVDSQSRWDTLDAPISIVHGTEDLTVPYDSAQALVEIYSQTGAYFELSTLQGAGHAAWNTTLNGQTLTELGFDFVARMLELDI